MTKIWLNQYQSGVPAEINPDNYFSLNDFFIKTCQRFSDSPALQSLGCQLTYRELFDLSGAFAAYVQQTLALKKGDRIALMLPNVLQYPVVLFGALQAGLIIVNVNPLYTVNELVHQLQDSGADTIVVLKTFAHTVEQALPQTQIKNVIVTDIGDLFPWPKSNVVNFFVNHIKKQVPSWSIPQAIPLHTIMRLGKKLRLEPVAVSKEDIAFLQYTGGTTGVAKGAMLTHHNLLANMEQIAAWAKSTLVEKKEIFITALPLYHIFSLTVNCFTPLYFGALNVLIANPRDVPHFVHEISKIPFTVLTGVNTLFNALLQNSEFIKLNFDKLKVTFGGGAALQKTVADHWQVTTGKVLLEGYGLTEASPVVCAMPLNSSAYNGSIGVPISSTDVCFRDDNGHPVAPGKIGELCVKGPQVMKAYWHSPEETAKVFTSDGWLLTGDLARMDDAGFIYIVDRKKDVILVSGFNVYPNEVEEVMMAHPGVLEVAAIGIPDPHSGEVVKAFVVRKDPNLTIQALEQYCAENLAGYKQPKVIEFCETLPKTPVGKVLRRALKGKG